MQGRKYYTKSLSLHMPFFETYKMKVFILCFVFYGHSVCFVFIFFNCKKLVHNPSNSTWKVQY